MIAREFVIELKEVRNLFEWKFYRRNGQIRGTLKTGEVQQLFDPITALCYLKTGKMFHEDSWVDAASALGLSWIDAGDIVAAANNAFDTSGASDAFGSSLRASLLETLLLDAETQEPFAQGLHAIQEFLGKTFRRDSAPTH